MSDNHESYSVRLSFRSHAKNMDKLVAVAKARGWLNARGRPNISKVLNYIIEQFDAARDARAAQKEGSRGRRRRTSERAS